MNAVAGRRGLPLILWILIALILALAIAWALGAFGGRRGGAAAQAGLHVGAWQVCTQPVPIPPGFDFPQPAGAVVGWVAQGNEARAREHGWYLWAGLSSPTAAGPVWRTWCTSTQAFAGASAAAPAAAAASDSAAASTSAAAPAPGSTAASGSGPASGPARASASASGPAPASTGTAASASGPAAGAAPASASASGSAAGPADSRAPGRRLSLGHRRRAVGGAAQAGEDPIRFAVSPVYTLPAAVLNNPAYAQCIQPASGGNPAALNDGPTLESNGDIMVAGVIFNPEAYGSIRSQQLYQPSILEGMLPPPGRQQPNWPRLAVNSVALKPMMWPVPQAGYWALPVWDNLTSDNGAYSGFEIRGQWSRAVAVTSETPAGGTRDVSLLQTNGGPTLVTLGGAALGPNYYAAAPVHSVNEFYGFRPDLASMDHCDRAILDASSYWAYGRPFQQGDYLLVVAMHIMTREQDDWTFQSVWWHDRPDVGPFAANRPDIPGATGPWRHYLMASTYGFLGPPGPAGEAQWPIAYNPYIELAANHPIRTNCMNCHHRAAAPGEPPPPAPPATWPVGSYEAARLLCGPPVPDALDVYAQDNAIFNSLLLVDSLWSISDRVPVVPPGRARARPAPAPASCPPAPSPG